MAAAASGEEEAVAGPPTRTLRSAYLRPGMQLAEDLVTEEGMLLLSKDFVLDEALIRKIRYFEHRLGRRFRVVVYKDPQLPESDTGAEEDPGDGQA
jgi:hypothetical protein